MEQSLNHSIQNIFFQVGQYDRYAIFDFHYGSAAFNKYGSTVYGYILYSPFQRSKLKLEISSGNTGNDDGLILLNGALQDCEKNQLLKVDGFYARDVRRLSALDLGATRNQYDNISIKDVPNTISVEFDLTGFNGEEMEMHIFRLRIENEIPLLPAEKLRYYGLMLLLEPDNLTEEDKAKILTNPETGRYHDDIIIAAFSPLVKADRMSPLKSLLSNALANRRKERIKFICRHLGVAPKHIDNLRVNNNNAWLELMKLVYGFESEVLTLWGWSKHVYWDFERFIHIYLRHYRNFLISESSKGQGTGFLYTPKDIRQIINIVLDENKAAIENHLEQGKGFRLQNNMGYYYNGDYYSLRIDPDGRLMQFHPQGKT